MNPPLRGRATPERATVQAEMLANRVEKRFRHLHPRFERAGVGAFRLYDHDIPEVRAVVDWYEGHLVVGEYVRLQTEGTPWLAWMARAVAQRLEVPAENVHLKRRRTRPEDGERYARLGHGGRRLEVREGPARFLVNLDDYLDTGLFPDHRQTRALVRREAAGRHFLNLYGYTGSFTVAAAQGGAASTTTVDASERYLAWAADNLRLNLPQADPAAHRRHAADVLTWLEAWRGPPFGHVVVDPPSFSTPGASHAAAFDVLQDHRHLLEVVLTVCAPDAIVWFSTNHQAFVPALDGLGFVETTARTVPEDFRGAPHRSWRRGPS